MSTTWLLLGYLGPINYYVACWLSGLLADVNTQDIMLNVNAK